MKKKNLIIWQKKIPSKKINKQMTKEEWLGKYPVVSNNDGTRLFVERSFVLKVMEEYAASYAKQQGIDFDIWKRENCINYDYENKAYSKMVFLDVDHTKVRCEQLSIDDTYNQFIEQQNKDNG